MSRTKILSLAKYVLACCATILWLAASGFSQSITVSPLSNPPNTTIFVSGSGFSAGADVDIYFDTTDLALAVTDDTGSFSQIALHVPASALPGEHTVSAVERSTGTSAQVSFRVNTNWSQFRMRASHDGHNLTENVLRPATVAGLSLLWKYTTGASGYSSYSSPAVANGMVYVGSFDRNVYALNASTGALRWKHTTLDQVQSSPAVANGVVYIGSGVADGNVYALKASTGALLWKYAAGRASSPAVANGVVYVGSRDRHVYALNAATGALLWKYTIGASVYSSPAVVNGVVYVGSDDHNVYALNASTGALLWKYTTGGLSTGSPVQSSPAVVDGVVYIGSDYPDNSVYALNATTGALLWKYTTGDRVFSSPAVANGVVYVGSDDGNVYALNASTGAPLWKYATGTILVRSSPAVANGVVYVGSWYGNVYALNARTGALLWKHTTDYYVSSSPAVANGVVYVGSDNGNVYAFGLTGSHAPALSQRPDPQTLSPDLSLPVSRPSAILPASDE
jgi:outer membrane protein assembly factor BamB